MYSVGPSQNYAKQLPVLFWAAVTTIFRMRLTSYKLQSKPGRSTLYLSTSVLKYNLYRTRNVLKYISEKSRVRVLVLKYISKVLRFLSTFRVQLSTFGFYMALFS